MNFVKMVNIPLVFHSNIFSSVCPSSKEERIICLVYLMQMQLEC
jgi:hypothetical protein